MHIVAATSTSFAVENILPLIHRTFEGEVNKMWRNGYFTELEN